MALTTKRVGLGAVGVLVVGLAAAGVAVAVASNGDHGGAARTATAGSRPGTGRPSVSPPSTATPKPLAVTSVSPTAGATGVRPEQPITVSFSLPLDPGGPVPRLDPPVAGHWTDDGSRLVFHPSAGYIPSTKETVTVPTGITAEEQGRTVELTDAVVASFHVGSGSILRLQELLAELRYLPLTFHPSQATTTSSTAPGSGAQTTAATTASSSEKQVLDAEPTQADAVATAPQAGTFTWSYPHIPAKLKALWATGRDNTITRGAVMAFEADHGLAVDGIAGPEVWTALVHAVAGRAVDPRPYSYIEVSEASPEKLSVWQAGRIVFTSLANTGVRGAATALGTYPIYTHEATTMMKGTDVDGTKYDVRVYDVGYFFKGDAVHGYPRASYGFPQSNGCVELPLAAARRVFDDDENYYGVLVTVSPA